MFFQKPLYSGPEINFLVFKNQLQEMTICKGCYCEPCECLPDDAGEFETIYMEPDEDESLDDIEKNDKEKR